MTYRDHMTAVTRTLPGAHSCSDSCSRFALPHCFPFSVVFVFITTAGWRSFIMSSSSPAVAPNLKNCPQHYLSWTNSNSGITTENRNLHYFSFSFAEFLNIWLKLTTFGRKPCYCLVGRFFFISLKL